MKEYQQKVCRKAVFYLHLLSNIVLNELDWWISDQWETFKSNHPYKHNGSKVQALKKSNLKDVTSLGTLMTSKFYVAHARKQLK